MSKSALPQLIEVRATLTPAGVWVANSPDLEGLSVSSSTQTALRESIREQIITVCRARGFEVRVTRGDHGEGNVTYWSIAILSHTIANGPDKIGGAWEEADFKQG